MIRVSLTFLVFIYLFLFLTTVFGVWLWLEWKRQRRERLAIRNRLRCSLCAFEFEDATSEPLPCCPSCGGRNERNPFRVL